MHLLSEMESRNKNWLQTNTKLNYLRGSESYCNLKKKTD